MTIKVLGPGCPNCARLEAVTRKAVSAAGVPVRIEKITDYREIAACGVLATPGLMIDHTLVCAGRIPSEAEVRTWLMQAGGNA
jgi:small redox-active disulfide protein 2